MLLKPNAAVRVCYSLFIAIFISISLNCSVQNPAEEAFQNGIFYERGGRYDAAIAEYTESFHADFNYTERFSKRGLRHKNLEYISTIVSDYIDIMRLNQIRQGSDNFLRYHENFEKTINQLTESIRANPHVAQLYYSLGVAYYLNGNFDKAIVNFTKAIVLNPSHAEAYYRRSLSYYAKADIDHVISDSTKAVELNTMHAYAYYVRGMAYAFYNKLDKAIEDFTKAIENHKNFDSAYYKRGQMYHKLVQQKKQGKIELAIFDYNMAVKIDPNNPNYYFSRGGIYLYTNDYDNAINDFTHVIDILPHYGTAYYNRAKAYFGKKEYGKSWEDMYRAEEMGFKSGLQFLDQLQKASGRIK